jgi:hypothetical protein
VSAGLRRRVVLAAPFGLGARRACAFDPTDRSAALRAFAKLTGTVASGSALRWHTGTVYAVVPGAPPLPLVGYEGLEKEAWRSNDDGSFSTAYFDIGYFRAIGGGGPLSSWNNSITNAAVTPMAFRSGRYAATLRAETFERELNVRGNEIWFPNRASVAFPSLLKPELYPEESAGPLHHFSVARIDRGRVADVDNAALASAPLNWSYTLTTVWLPWMKMGQRPGSVVWVGIGGKYPAVDDVPATFRAFLDHEQPNYLTDAEPWQDVRNMWGDYMRAHPPSGAIPGSR